VASRRAAPPKAGAIAVPLSIISDCIQLQIAHKLSFEGGSCYRSAVATNRGDLAMTKRLTAMWLLAVTLSATLLPVLAQAQNLQNGGPG
jgi:hypothetical protein